MMKAMVPQTIKQIEPWHGLPCGTSHAKAALLVSVMDDGKHPSKE